MIYLIAFALIALDFITGIVKGAATGTLSSTVMREGLYKKASLILLMALGCLADYAQGFIDLGISVPAAAAVCSYIGVMEITSTLENICEINPDIMPERLTALFGIVETVGFTITGEQATSSAKYSDASASWDGSASDAEATEQSEEDTTDEPVAAETTTGEAVTADAAAETTTTDEE